MANPIEGSKRIKLQFILIGTSFVGIIISIIFPIAYNLILLAFCIMLLISTRILTKNLIIIKAKRSYWIPTFAIGIFSIISLLTPESYNTLVIQLSDVDDFHWLWQLEAFEQVQIIKVFYLPSILILGLIIVSISLKIKKNINNLVDNPRVLRITANILVIFPLILYNGKIFNFWLSYFILIPGFAIFGPLFSGFMIKDQIKIHQEELSLSYAKYELRKNKLGFGYTITAGLIFLLLGCNINNLDEFILFVISPLIPIEVAVVLIFYYKILLILIGVLMLVLPFLSTYYPRIVAIFLLIARRIIILHSFLLIIIFVPLYIKAMFLILYIPAKISIIDSIKTFNLLKLKKFSILL